MKEENLVFIVSQPRSGSTYLQNILSNNPYVNTVSEPWIMLGLAPILKPEMVKAKYDHQLTMLAFNDYLQKFPQININKSLNHFAKNLYEPMFNEFDFVIDKTPRYWEILDQITNVFPNSKVIILKRDPVDVVKSMIRTWNIHSIERLNYFRRDLLLAPMVMHNFAENHKLNKNVYSLCYESLINHPELEFKKLYDWIGVDFNRSYLDSKSNRKYKGKYGDPYQNNSTAFSSNAKVKKKKFSKVTEKFLEGYVNYLGSEFLNSYGGYASGNYNKNSIFNFYMALGDKYEAKSFKKEFLLKIKSRFIGDLLI